jgi:hypothetical protein
VLAIRPSVTSWPELLIVNTAALLRAVVKASFWEFPWESTNCPLVAPLTAWSWKKGHVVVIEAVVVIVVVDEGNSEAMSIIVVVMVVGIEMVGTSVTISSSAVMVTRLVMVLVI